MDLATALSGGLDLSGAAGLNAWIPLFATGLLNRLGALDIASPYDDLSSTPALIALGLLLAADFVGDKIPAVDSVLHVAGVVVHPVAGAVVFAGQAGLAHDVPPVVPLLAGGGVAGRVPTPPARPPGLSSTALTAGIGNPVVSLLEDATSGTFTAVAVIVPLLAFLLVPAALVALLLAGRSAVRRTRR